MNRRQLQNESPKRVALYARSSWLQPLGEIQTLQAQVDRCTAYCLEHGCIVPHDQRLASVRAGSADRDRPALACLCEAVRQGRVAIVVVSSLDRLTRDPIESAILLEEFKAARVTIVTAGA
jgi:DNA invertase Pin-like site-specific DNA recombinase